jgi:hypothetical protein
MPAAKAAIRRCLEASLIMFFLPSMKVVEKGNLLEKV